MHDERWLNCIRRFEKWLFFHLHYVVCATQCTAISCHPKLLIQMVCHCFIIFTPLFSTVSLTGPDPGLLFSLLTSCFPNIVYHSILCYDRIISLTSSVIYWLMLLKSLEEVVHSILQKMHMGSTQHHAANWISTTSSNSWQRRSELWLGIKLVSYKTPTLHYQARDLILSLPSS